MAYCFDDDKTKLEVKQAIVKNTSAITINAGASATLWFSYSDEFNAPIFGVASISALPAGVVLTGFEFLISYGSITLRNIGSTNVSIAQNEISVRLCGLY